MKSIEHQLRHLILILGFMCSTSAYAFGGGMVDTIADVMSWVVVIVMPVALVVVFWIVHIWPEKIAEKRQHPQKDAIHALCMLSLVFGGLLWPIAFLWAYTRPSLYKLAYGNDKYIPVEVNNKNTNQAQDRG